MYVCLPYIIVNISFSYQRCLCIKDRKQRQSARGEACGPRITGGAIMRGTPIGAAALRAREQGVMHGRARGDGARAHNNQANIDKEGGRTRVSERASPTRLKVTREPQIDAHGSENLDLSRRRSVPPRRHGCSLSLSMIPFHCSLPVALPLSPPPRVLLLLCNFGMNAPPLATRLN